MAVTLKAGPLRMNGVVGNLSRTITTLGLSNGSIDGPAYLGLGYGGRQGGRGRQSAVTVILVVVVVVP